MEFLRQYKSDDLNADNIEIGERLFGTKIPNDRVIISLMNIASVIAKRDEKSELAHLMMLKFHIDLRAIPEKEGG